MSELIDYRKPVLVQGAHIMDNRASFYGVGLRSLDGFAVFRLSAS